MQKRNLEKATWKCRLSASLHGNELFYGPPKDKQRNDVSPCRRGTWPSFFDTAEVVRPFTNEELVGEALAPFRREGRDRHQVWVRSDAAIGRPGAAA